MDESGDLSMTFEDRIRERLQQERQQRGLGDGKDENTGERSQQIYEVPEGGRNRASEYEPGQFDNERFPFATSNRNANLQHSRHSFDEPKLQVLGDSPRENPSERILMTGSFIVQGCGTRPIATHNVHRMGDNDIAFTELVFLSNALEDNWIARDVVDDRRLRWEDNDLPEGRIDFNGDTIECCGRVSAFWLPGQNKRDVPTTLYIAKQARFRILFGWQFLEDQGLATFDSRPDI